MFALVIVYPLGYFLEVCSQKYRYWVRGSGTAVYFPGLVSSSLPGNTNLASGTTGKGCLPALQLYPTGLPF